MYSALVIKTPERCNSRRSDVFILNFEHILHLFKCFCFSLGTVKYFLGKSYQVKKSMFKVINGTLEQRVEKCK